MSQPSRAVYIVFNLLKVSFELKDTRIMKMEHKTPEFKKINPVGKRKSIDFNP
jgi:glutathione S-transferase